MLVKNRAKIILRYHEQTFWNLSITNHLISLHKSPHPYCFTRPSSHESCGQMFKNIFFSLDLLLQKLFYDKNHWFQLLSTKNYEIISLLLISITLHSLSVNHSIVSSVGEEALAFDKNFIATPHQVTPPYARKFCFFSFFHFFHFSLLAYWDHYSKFAGLNPANVLPNSLWATNIWIISFDLKVAWYTTV